jgi:hypothetical protein
MKARKLGRPSSRLNDAITYLEFIVEHPEAPFLLSKTYGEGTQKMPVIKSPELIDFPVAVHDSDRRASGYKYVAQVSRDGKIVVVLGRT